MSGLTTTTPLPQGGAIINYPKPTTDLEEKQAAGGITFDLLSAALMKADDLGSVKITTRENLCGTWFRAGDLGFIFGERGLGKTWLGFDMAECLSEGRSCGPWPITTSRRVLYVDGEMPLDGIRDRHQALRRADTALTVLHHERLFHETGAVLNLTSREAQNAVIELCEQKQIEVIILDNLSCLFSGMKENEADHWEMVLPWLLNLRRRKIAVVIIAHSGRSGQTMRGTSRREDAAFWVIRLDAVPEHERNGDGARFISRFTKARQGTSEEVEPLTWHYQPDGDKVRPTFARLQSTELFKQWVRDGLTSCSDIAEQMGMTKGAVSKIATRGVRDGWLQIKYRDYVLVAQ